ncbi:MAG: ribosome recycling factor [Lachnospiraceae bacterium]|jgi:ribosome recycling factor|nr:ribosome recycling factor [Lachnospiraceae bacterium]
MADEQLKVYDEKMKKAVDFLGTELQAVRAGRANPHVLDRVRVDYYGTPTPIAQVANISVPEARIIQITPWEKKMVKEISRAIQMADIGINPTTDATMVRLVFPELTEERRKELVKEVKKLGEDSKQVVRNARRDGNEDFKKKKKSGEVSEDVIADLSDQLQKMTDKYIDQIDDMIDKKQKELMTV